MMTEVLLNVTNRQIEAICKEEHQRFLKKYKGIVAYKAVVVDICKFKNKIWLVIARLILSARRASGSYFLLFVRLLAG